MIPLFATLALVQFSVVPVPLAGPPARSGAAVPQSMPRPEDDAKALARKAPAAARWPNAQKATLLDLADIVVRPDGTARTVTRQAIKVFTALGREQESEVRIPYNGAFETVRLIRARTIRPDGSVLEVKPADVRRGSAGEYDDARSLSISMPGVQPGCIIDYEYVTDQRASQMPGAFWTQWYFQGGTDPVLYTRLRITSPKSLPLRRRIRNTQVEPTERTSADGKSIVRTWEQRNVAAFEIEPMMPDAEGLLPKLTVSTVADWRDVGTWYARLAQGRAAATPAIRALAGRLVAGKRSPEDKARAIFRHVQEKTRYVAIELGISAYQPRPAERTIRNEYGDCKDMATLLVALLRAAGVPAWPVLLEAGSDGSPSQELPSPSAFNHAICLAEVDGRKVWLDATAQVCPWGVVPGADRGCEVLVIRDDGAVWDRIPEGHPADEDVSVDARLKLAADGSARGTVVVEATGDTAMGLRLAHRMATRDRLKPLVESLLSTMGSNPRILSTKLPSATDLDSPMRIEAEVELPTYAALSGNLLLLKARPDQAAGSVGSPLDNRERVHPVHQGQSRRQTGRLRLSLPEGCTVLSQPGPVALEGPIGSFLRTVEVANGSIDLRVVNEDRKGTVPASQSGAVRSYLSGFLKAFSETIVLKLGP
ncbi:MAG: DUF3857 domain-containing transglutaminase family protein [Armatimonadota bacterium]